MMSILLYIQASPRKERSKSIKVADAFVAAYRQANPDDEVVTLNLFEVDLPVFDGPTLDTKYAILHGIEPTDEQKAAWAAVERVISQFTAADKYLLATPMWNFNIPYKLKHYIDVLVQPTYTFNYSPEDGYSGLVTSKPAAIIHARGGAYDEPETAPLDMQRPYLELMLGFIGFTDIRSITIEPTLMGGPDIAAERIATATQAAEQIARDF